MFFGFWATIYFERKNSLDLRNPQSTDPWKLLGNFFWNFRSLSHLFGISSKKPSVGNFFSGLSQLQCALLEAYFEEREIFKTKFFFVHLFWSLDNFLDCWQKKSGCQRNNLIKQRKIGGRNLWKNCFLIHLRTWSRKFEQLDKIYSQHCQNHFHVVQQNNFWTFLRNEETLLKFSGRWAKLMDFWHEFFCQIS